MSDTLHIGVHRKTPLTIAADTLFSEGPSSVRFEKLHVEHEADHRIEYSCKMR